MSGTKMSIAVQIQKIREHFGLSQSELSKELGLSASFIGKVEQGVYTLTEANADKMCELYGINRSWLETGEGAMFQEGREVPPVDFDHIPERMKQIRKRYGVNQLEFAQAVGCSQHMVTSIEQGRAHASRKLLARIAEEFDISMMWLLTGEGKIEETDIDKQIEKIDAYMRENEIARLLVLEAMKKDSGIWVRFDRVVHEE